MTKYITLPTITYSLLQWLPNKTIRAFGRRLEKLHGPDFNKRKVAFLHGTLASFHVKNSREVRKMLKAAL